MKLILIVMYLGIKNQYDTLTLICEKIRMNSLIYQYLGLWSIYWDR
jgi:hypothetical protein